MIPVLFACIGLVVFILAIKWYQKLERDDSETFNYQLNIEKHYEDYFDEEDQEHADN